MTREEFCVLSGAQEAAEGRAPCGAELFRARALQSRKTARALAARGLLDGSGAITPAGLAALEPYRVEHAVILAAGSASRFVPLSLERPKALYEVRGEKLIERQIQQLRDAGVTDITVVLGYKKDMFAYLAEKFGVRLLFNPAYNIKNNIESLLVARAYLENSYICVCDSYYLENPFHRYEYRSFYAGYSSREQEDEFYCRIDAEGRIVGLDKGKQEGLLLLGHAYWQRDFAEKFTQLAEADRETGRYDDKFWEWLLKDELAALPPIWFKEYAPGAIREFDFFEQLRQFDVGYVNHTRSDIIRNIKLVFRCEEEDIIDFRTVREGLTNISFIFSIDGTQYIYRHPGTGTEMIIDRRHEKASLIRAKEYGIDPTYIYMDTIEGWKISTFVDDFREPDYADFADSQKILAVLRRLHALPVRPDYGLRPWEDAESMEVLLKEKDPDCFAAHEALKRRVGRLCARTRGDGVEPCFCHGDTYKHNWMLRPDGSVILIDWEYAGLSDPGVDVGYYIVDAMYGYDEALRFIRAYLGAERTAEKEFHFLAYAAIIAYYWFVWALYRESCGAVMGESLSNWREMAERCCGWLEEREEKA